MKCQSWNSSSSKLSTSQEPSTSFEFSTETNPITSIPVVELSTKINPITASAPETNISNLLIAIKHQDLTHYLEHPGYDRGKLFFYEPSRRSNKSGYHNISHDKTAV